MSTNHVVAWIDHAQAHIIHFNPESTSTEVVKAHSMHHAKAGVDGAGGTRERALYFDEVADALGDSREILIVGPGQEKLALMKHLLAHRQAVAQRVVGLESADHPSDAQLVKHARSYFLKVDWMR